MPRSMKSNKGSANGVSNGVNPPSTNLWVGNLSQDVTDADLIDLFGRFGPLDSVTTYSTRSFAFVYFKLVEDASTAKDALQGALLRSSPMKIEYARPQSSSGGKREGQPSNILWIGYPPSLQMDEQILHNAMILFGEIERIKSFPSRHYSFVEFRSVDEARRAKEGLQGRLFNDPRITIMYSSSELGPGKEISPFYSGLKGVPRSDTLNDQLYGSGEVELYDRHASLNTTELNEIASLQADATWRRPSSAGILPSPAPRIKETARPGSSGWDVEGPQIMRESKRARIDPSFVPDEDSFSPRNGFRPNSDLVKRKNSLSPVGVRNRGFIDNDFIWRGTIAKGGTPVCHARCVPIGNGMETELPAVVNCSARTGLDMLAKHYTEAPGFDIMFFLPDSEDDFASYTEFLRYLGSKSRAGVAKFDDGTTLFLVPPSDFLTKLLNVKGPERLYGVVLKLPQPSPVTPPIMHLPLHPPITHHHQIPPPEHPYNLHPHGYGSVPVEDPKPLMVSSALKTGAATTPAVSLTPELIATLTSILPITNPSSGAESGSGTAYPSAQIPSYSSHAGNLNGIASRPLAAFSAPAQSAQYASAQVGQHYQVETYNPAVAAQNPAALIPNQFQAASYAQTLPAVSLPADKTIFDASKQGQSFPNVSSAVPQATAEAEVDKNQRYQSTLQFAASLLKGLQQQQPGMPTSQGS